MIMEMGSFRLTSRDKIKSMGTNGRASSSGMAD